MKIFINYPTGNTFIDGTAEIGKVEEHDVESRVDLDDILPEDDDFFITLEDGTETTVFDLYCQLD